MKTLLQKIKQIKHQCEQHVDCTNCIFHNGRLGCKVSDVTYLLCRRPCHWNLEQIEEKMNAA